ncbi:MAG: hypothetical protein SOY61_00485 [Campylobacter sp.]|nr:hypothetical protein [Campylobacter sp.]
MRNSRIPNLEFLKENSLADEAMKTGDVNSVFNAMKPEKYKVKNSQVQNKNAPLTTTELFIIFSFK